MGSIREEAAGELRALLARRRISASELSRRLNWKQSYMARRIDGRVALDLDDLQAIAAALEVSVLDLLPSSVRVNYPVSVSATTDRKSRPAKSTRPPARRDTINRPSGQPSSDRPPGVRRTARVPRAGHA